MSSASQSTAGTADRLRFGAGAVVALVVLAAFAAHTALVGTTPDFPLDDAYTVLHNARLLHEGGADPTYPGVPALVGSTSAVHLAIVALLGFVLPLPLALHGVAWAGALLYGLGCARLAGAAGAGPRTAAGFGLAALLVSDTPMQLLNGLETGLAMAAVAWALALAAEGVTRRPLATAALAGAMPFIRPELAALAAPLFGWLMLATTRAAGDMRGGLARCAGPAAVAVLVAAPWMAWALAETGGVLPATAAAKRAWFAEAGLGAGRSLALVGVAVASFLGPFWMAILAAPQFPVRTAAGRLAIGFAGLVVGSFAVNLPGALFHNDQRYLYGLAPVLLLAIAQMARAPLRLPGGRTIPPAWVIGLFVAQAVVLAPAGIERYRAALERTDVELASLSRWARETLPANAHLLVHDVGHLSWATGFRITDLVGLKTPSSIPDHLALTLPSNGARRGEAVARIAARAGATHLVALDEWDRLFAITDGLRAAGWTLVPVRGDGRYRVYALTPPV
ncbi:hypothetical protein [Chthonobacter rhizosphaerae]|uniref:hypothetical protein n=1 Tax=Chthonobacter rhizosphaerae TaxID=2735553 RepID=UPI0015EEC527|nr:hypothetical protein [Chthonobacter rhizosphaerae]